MNTRSMNSPETVAQTTARGTFSKGMRMIHLPTTMAMRATRNRTELAARSFPAKKTDMWLGETTLRRRVFAIRSFQRSSLRFWAAKMMARKNMLGKKIWPKVRESSSPSRSSVSSSMAGGMR